MNRVHFESKTLQKFNWLNLLNINTKFLSKLQVEFRYFFDVILSYKVLTRFPKRKNLVPKMYCNLVGFLLDTALIFVLSTIW